MIKNLPKKIKILIIKSSYHYNEVCMKALSTIHTYVEYFEIHSKINCILVYCTDRYLCTGCICTLKLTTLFHNFPCILHKPKHKKYGWEKRQEQRQKRVKNY